MYDRLFAKCFTHKFVLMTVELIYWLTSKIETGLKTFIIISRACTNYMYHVTTKIIKPKPTHQFWNQTFIYHKMCYVLNVSELLLNFLTLSLLDFHRE